MEYHKKKTKSKNRPCPYNKISQVFVTQHRKTRRSVQNFEFFEPRC